MLYWNDIDMISWKWDQLKKDWKYYFKLYVMEKWDIDKKEP